MFRRALAITAFVVGVAACSVDARDLGRAGDVRAGRDLAVTSCSECHQVVPRRWTRRPAGGAPDFVDIANAPGATRTSLFVFLHSPHPTMPSLVLSDRESNDVIAYLLSLRDPSRRRP